MAPFFSNLWMGIQTLIQGSVDWILGKIRLLNKPLEWMSKAKNKLMGWLGGDGQKQAYTIISKQTDTSTAVLGQTIASAPTIPPAIPLVNTVAIDVSSQPSTMAQTVRIDAPITIHASPGMDAKAIAYEVQKALDEREQRAAVHSRAFLYDAANA